MEDWTDKYKPRNLDDIYGNRRAIATLRNWAYMWKEGNPPKNRAVVLVGKPGVGKTTSALALANDFQWILLEMNASDARNAIAIKKIATFGAVNETFDNSGRFIPSNKGGRKLIVMDEADNFYEKEEKSKTGSDLSDKGGKKAIIETIKVTNQPIILIVNNYYDLIRKGGEIFKRICTTIPFYDIKSDQIVELLKKICQKEKIHTDLKVLEAIANRCKGDVRAAINDLQSVCMNRHRIKMQHLNVLGYRDRENVIFDTVREIFKTKNIQSIKDNLSNIDVPPETLLLWLSENLPREYEDANDLVKGYEALSKADVFFGRVVKRQYYGFWSYACDVMCGGIATAKSRDYSNSKYYPPTWLKEMKNSKINRGIRESIVGKVGKFCHNSHKKGKEFLLPQFKVIFQNDIEFASKISKELNFTETEIKHLLGEKYEYMVEDILQVSKSVYKKQIEVISPISNKLEDKKEKKEKPQKIKQPSLFDF